MGGASRLHTARPGMFPFADQRTTIMGFHIWYYDAEPETSNQLSISCLEVSLVLSVKS
jgi:hypothetical protein